MIAGMTSYAARTTMTGEVVLVAHFLTPSRGITS